jgi:hypothetical protein
MHRPSTVVACALVSAALIVFAPQVTAAQQTPSVAPSRLDSLAAQLVELELQRVTRPVSSALFADDRPRDCACSKAI